MQQQVFNEFNYDNCCVWIVKVKIIQLITYFERRFNQTQVECSEKANYYVFGLSEEAGLIEPTVLFGN